MQHTDKVALLCPQLWRDLFPNAAISYVEYDKPCAEKFRSEIERKSRGTLYAGDQEDPDLIRNIVANATADGLFDIIVDDGGHNPTKQLISFRGLWPALASGGIYIVEDVHTNYYGNDTLPIWRPRDGIVFMNWVGNLVNGLLHCYNLPQVDYREQHFTEENKAKCNEMSALEKEILSIECTRKACVFVKA